MITDAMYYQIVSEAYDLSDFATKQKVIFCNEAQKTANVEHIANKLYESIKTNVTEIDFGSIPRSKGVVSRIENYGGLVECIGTIKDLVDEYSENPNLINTVSQALENVQARERIFTKAFAMNIEFPVMIYNVSVLAVVSAISLMITTCIEYIKGGHDSFEVSFNKAAYHKSKDHVLFQYLEQFNATCANDSLDKMMNGCIKNNLVATRESVEVTDGVEAVNEFDIATAAGGIGKVVGTGKDFFDAKSVAGKLKVVAGAYKSASMFGKIVLVVLGTGAAIIGIINLLRLIRRGLYYWYSGRSKISEWLEVQACFLQINAENLKYRDDDKGDDHRKKVYQSQMKWVQRLRNLANFVALKDAKAKKDEQKRSEEEQRETYSDDQDDSDSLF